MAEQVPDPDDIIHPINEKLDLQPRASTSMDSPHQQLGTPTASDICTMVFMNTAGQSNPTSSISVSFWLWIQSLLLNPPAASKSTYAPKPPSYPPPPTPTPPVGKTPSAADRKSVV